VGLQSVAQTAFASIGVPLYLRWNSVVLTAENPTLTAGGKGPGGGFAAVRVSLEPHKADTRGEASVQTVCTEQTTGVVDGDSAARGPSNSY
jgi:hypothetical protein